jgi:hypothetical protein
MYDDVYSVGIDGTVKNIHTEYTLKPYIHKRYYRISLAKKNYFIHCLVAKCWLIPPTDDNCVIDHIDRNPLNNHASNLRWVSRSENNLNSNPLKKARKTNKSTKEQYISVYKNRPNLFYINKKGYVKSYNTLEEAIVARNQLLITLKDKADERLGELLHQPGSQ